MTHFYRACPKHFNELREDPSLEGRERLYCPVGQHHTDSGLVVSDEGDRVGKAWATKVEMFVGDPLPRPRWAQRQPDHPCKHGHFDWSYQKSSMRWRCRTCNRERSRIEAAKKETHE
jgi:hypothetical protein